MQAEAGTAADAPKVAAVITNRLKQQTPLQIDATLCYAKGGCPPVPNNTDKQIDSPYNTYRVSGLPPTPIMTVTEQSLRAALGAGERPLSVLRDRQGWGHVLRHHAGGARGQHPGSRSTRGMTLNGETRITGLIGDPVAHSRSPAILNAAYRGSRAELGLRRVSGAAGRGGEAVKAARALGLAGLTVTMPHKADAAWACDELTADAGALGAVNVVTVLDDGRLAGSSTDGEGFLRSVRDEGFDPAGTDVLVAGAGGAARAIVLALGGAGARVTVAARRRDAADTAAGLVPGGHGASLADIDPGVFALVVNATPLGMQGEPGPVPVERLNPGQLVVDTVYHPMETPFLAAARARGIHVANGLGMLVHQAALAFERWTGLDAPVAVMRTAAAHGSDGGMTVALVVGCSLLGLVIGWLLDPVITRVPLKQPVLGPPGPDEPPPPRGRRVTVAVVNGALFGGDGGALRRLVDAGRLPRAHRRRSSRSRPSTSRPTCCPTGSCTRSRSRCWCCCRSACSPTATPMPSAAVCSPG